MNPLYLGHHIYWIYIYRQSLVSFKSKRWDLKGITKVRELQILLIWQSMPQSTCMKSFGRYSQTKVSNHTHANTQSNDWMACNWFEPLVHLYKKWSRYSSPICCIFPFLNTQSPLHVPCIHTYQPTMGIPLFFIK